MPDDSDEVSGGQAPSIGPALTGSSSSCNSSPRSEGSPLSLDPPIGPVRVEWVVPSQGGDAGAWGSNGPFLSGCSTRNSLVLQPWLLGGPAARIDGGSLTRSNGTIQADSHGQDCGRCRVTWRAEFAIRAATVISLRRMVAVVAFAIVVRSGWQQHGWG